MNKAAAGTESQKHRSTLIKTLGLLAANNCTVHFKKVIAPAAAPEEVWAALLEEWFVINPGSQLLRRHSIGSQ